MRRTLIAVLAVLALPSATAQASTVVTAKVTCTSSTVTGSFSYMGFEGTNSASQQILQDGKPYGAPQEATGVDDHWSPTDYGPVDRPADGISHQYMAVTRWAEAGGEHVRASDPLTCAPVPVPPPPPPPVVVPPVVIPPPVPPVVTPPPVHRYRCRCVVRIVKPKATHGRRDFGGRLVTRGRIVESWLTVKAVGAGRPVVGKAKARLHTKGGVFTIWLYDLTIWKHRLAWGDYRLSYRFKVRVNGHVCFVKRIVHYRNHDPEGGPA